MKKLDKLVASILFPILLVSFLWVGSFFVLAQDTSVLSMSGQGWSLKVDSSLNIALDSKSVPYVSVAKAGSEKELFLQLNSLKDCIAGQVQFRVEMLGLRISKQLPLDKELNVSDYDFVNSTVAMRKGQVVVSRPESVVNSFACFDGGGRKVLHIYASKLVDAKGDWVWVDSDLKGGVLTVYLDQKFLGSAVFPVVVDPTFGYTSVGGTGEWYDSYISICNFSVTENADVSDINIYMGNAGLTRIVGGVYDSAKNKIVQTVATDSSAIGWVQISLVESLTVGEHWFAVWGNTTTVLEYDTDATIHSDVDWTDSETLPASLTFVGGEYASTKKFSIYLNYVPTPTPTPSPSPSPSPSPVPSSTPSTFTVVLGEADWVLFLEVVMLVACFVVLGWFNRVPLFGYLVGFFAFVVGIYVLIGGLWASSLAIGFFGVFVGVVGGLTMLFVGLGVRVRGRR